MYQRIGAFAFSPTGTFWELLLELRFFAKDINLMFKVGSCFTSYMVVNLFCDF